MEGIIPFIIMLLLGSLFSGKKKSTEEGKRQKPYNAEPKQQDTPIKKLKEMSRDLYKEIQQELEQESNQAERRLTPTPTPIESFPKVNVQQSTVQSPERIDEQEGRQGRRTETRRVRSQQQTKVKKSTVENSDLVPRNSDDIMKGIIFAEIIGPPKSRR